ncbi:endonuclease III [Halodesulfurarchaeum sp.]|uniref:endonuclease III n=1 Tax=Halodesulfurarchaeum sp. TaxID=1980530 RepID=UPI002FC3731A
MGTPRDTRSEQTAVVIERLREAYPDATISLSYANRFELLIAVVLSAQCTDARVNQITDTLFEEYQTPNDFASASEERVAEVIGSCTYPNSKAGYLVGIGEKVLEEYDGEVPDSLDSLTELPGVGRKTANVVMQHGHDTASGIAVDTHVQRLTQRLEITDAERPEAIEQELLELVPDPDWKPFTHWMISHGRAVCTARSPACEDCVLEDICPASRLEE